jgi:hypothetical protein
MPDDRKKANPKPSTSKKKSNIENFRSLLHPGEALKRNGRPQPKYEPSYVAFTRSRYKIFETTNPFTSDYQKTFINANKSANRRNTVGPSMFLLPVPKIREPLYRVVVPSTTKLEPASSSSEVTPKRLSFELSNREKMIKQLMEAEKQFQAKIVCTCEGETMVSGLLLYDRSFAASRPRIRDIDVILRDKGTIPHRSFQEQRTNWLQRLEHAKPKVRLSDKEVEVEDDTDIFCFSCCKNNFLCSDPYRRRLKPKPIERNVKIIKVGRK